MEAFSGAIGFTYLIERVPGIGDADLTKLTITIAFENLAIGMAGAAYIAWLSSIVSKSSRGAVCAAVVADAAGGHARARGPWRNDRKPGLLRFVFI